MFRGIHNISIDDKGRIALPARYRESFSQQLVVTIDPLDKCLLLYPMPTWQSIEQQLEALPGLDQATRRIQRLLIGHAFELNLDANGRILIPQLLRDHAELGKQVVMLGQGKKFELWSDISWATKREQWLATQTSPEFAINNGLEKLSL